MATSGQVAPPHDDDPATSASEVAANVTPHLRHEPLQQRSRDRVAALLDAAEALVIREGADALTTRTLAAASGVPVATLYKWFSDRESLLIALIDRDMKRMDEQVVTDLLSMSEWTVETFVRTALGAFVKIHMTSPCFVEIYLRGGRSTQAVADYGREHNAAVAALLRDLVVAEGLLVPDVTLSVAEVALEVGDRMLQLAFAESYEPNMSIVEEGVGLLTAHLERFATPAGLSGLKRAV